MKIALLIHTPGQAHLWRYPVKLFERHDNKIIVLARNDGCTCELLDSFGISYSMYGSAQRIWQKIARLPSHFSESFRTIKRFDPDIIVGAGFIEAYCAALLHKPCLIFEDSESTPKLERIQWRYLTTRIITPECFKLDFGKKHIRFPGYKELAYLHPDNFLADPAIFQELKIQPDQKYIILRFNSFDAFHDVSRRGFSLEDKYKLIGQLKNYAKIFISDEGKLPSDLKKYELPISPERIHHALFYAHMVVADTGTIITEAAVLGTPAIINLSNVKTFGNFTELEERYGLIYTFSNSSEAIRQSVKLIQETDLKEKWEYKRQMMLRDKIDVTLFLVDLIENMLKWRDKQLQNELS